MYEVFTKLLNMSLLASVLVIAVILLRIVLKKAPKKIVCALWILVAFRLICPISISSPMSVFNVLNFGLGTSSKVEYFQYNEKTEKPALSFDVPSLVNDDMSPDSMTIGTRTADVHLPTVMYIWMAGVIIMLSYALISYVKIRREASASIKRADNVFVCDEIKSPFILGVIRPRIYLPSGLKKSVEESVLAHENAHLKRFDFLWKPLGFLLLSVYWFNLIMWVAYILFCRDIEAACDEKVIEDLDREGKAYYSEALLACASGRKMITVCPLAFGETDVKGRVKNVLNYKKPAFWIVLVAVLSCVVVGICFMTNPKESTYSIKIVIPANSKGQFYYSEEEISPTNKMITVYSEEGVGDTEVVLKTVEVNEENTYEPTYITHAMPVELEAEKGGWFKIGIWEENSTNEDKELFLTVKNVTVRIADESWYAFATEKALASSEMYVDNPATDILMRFFAYFDVADYASMAEVATHSCKDTFFHENDVFGYKRASIEKYTEQVVDKRTYKFQVDVQMEATPQSALYPETETTFSVYVVYENGRWLVDKFTTD